MKFYHGTTKEKWKLIQKEGVLWGFTNYNGVRSYRYTYMSPNINVAKKICSEVILEVEYSPVGVDDRGIDNYGFDPPPKQYCWQFSVFIPINITHVRRLSVKEIKNIQNSWSIDNWNKKMENYLIPEK